MTVYIFFLAAFSAVTSPLQSVLSAAAPLSLPAVSVLHLSELSSQQLQAALCLLLAGPLHRHRRLQVPHTQLVVTRTGRDIDKTSLILQ